MIVLSTSTLRSFFFNDTATTEIYTLSLHDALPIWQVVEAPALAIGHQVAGGDGAERAHAGLHGELLWFASDEGEGRTPNVDRKSTRLNSSHANISYAVFCLKKKKLRRNECALYCDR